MVRTQHVSSKESRWMLFLALVGKRQLVTDSTCYQLCGNSLLLTSLTPTTPIPSVDVSAISKSFNNLVAASKPLFILTQNDVRSMLWMINVIPREPHSRSFQKLLLFSYHCSCRLWPLVELGLLFFCYLWRTEYTTSLHHDVCFYFENVLSAEQDVDSRT